MIKRLFCCYYFNCKKHIFEKVKTVSKMALIVFDDDTDYEEVEMEVKQEYAKWVATNCGCCGKGDLCDINVFMLGIDINKELGDTVRYEEAVESAYKLLYY